MRLNWAPSPMDLSRFLLILASLGITCPLANGQVATTEENGIIVRSQNGESKSKNSTQFLRVTKDSKGELDALQTSMTRFRSADGEVTVDLIGAVHIGERDYYRLLNRQFELYDVVLYELVAPEGTRVPAGGSSSSGNPISFLQQSARKMLGLESQLELIDYQKKNFVHADMSPRQIGEKMEERGDTAFTIGLSAITEVMRNQGKIAKSIKQTGNNSTANSLASESLFELMGNPLKLKQMMAQQFTQPGAMEIGLGETLNRMLIDDRNAAAIKVLRKELSRGNKHIAIFYGAAHMPDFEQRLVKLGMKRTDQVWIDAWDLKTAPSKSASPASLLFDMLRQMER